VTDSSYSDLESFRDYLNALIMSDCLEMTPEEALEEFRLMQAPATRAECLDAIRESFAEIQSGAPGKLASEYLAELRARYGWDS
jgi:hypothetical protein